VAVPAVVVADLCLWRSRLVLRRGFWAAYAIVLAFQLLVNAALTVPPVVAYDADVILGVRLAGAPIEDIGYGFTLVLLTMSAWTANRPGRRRRRRRGAER
jgi:lycopene cyclase domain-containing protein